MKHIPIKSLTYWEYGILNKLAFLFEYVRDYVSRGHQCQPSSFDARLKGKPHISSEDQVGSLPQTICQDVSMDKSKFNFISKGHSLSLAVFLI